MDILIFLIIVLSGDGQTLRNERVALPAASARLVRPLGDQACRPNCLPVLVPQVELLETTPISLQQAMALTLASIQAPAPTTTTMPPPPLHVSSAPTISSHVPRMEVLSNVIASMALPTTEEMEETMFILPEDSHATEAQLQTPTMGVEDTLIPMDHNSNTTHQEHQELQDVTDLLAEVEATVNTVPTTTNQCINNSNTTVSTDGEICQAQIQVSALRQHNRLLQTPPASVIPHLPQT